MREFWLSCTKMTVRVRVDDDDRIIESAPIVKRFKGQPLDNLTTWMKGLGGFSLAALNSEVKMESIQTVNVRVGPWRVKPCVHCSIEFLIDSDEFDDPAGYDIRCPSCLWRWLPGYAVPPVPGEVYNADPARRLPKHLQQRENADRLTCFE